MNNTLIDSAAPYKVDESFLSLNMYNASLVKLNAGCNGRITRMPYI